MNAWLRLARRSVLLLALGICALAPFSTAVYGVRTQGAMPKLALVGAVIAAGWALWRFRAALRRAAGAAAEYLARMPAPQFWLLAWGGGALLRLLWWTSVPPVLPEAGDAVVNWRIAQGLIERGEFVAETTFGTWRGLYPPGLPFTLVPFIVAFGSVAVAVLVANLCFFALGLFFVHAGCRRLAGAGPARLGALILALLPNLVAYASQPYKEPLLVAQLAFAVYALARAHDASSLRGIAAWAAGGGMALGYAILTQSSLAPALGLIALLGLLDRRSRWPAVRAGALLLGAALVIAPWSVRQSATFGKFVPLTTGAGWSFYTANNAASQGAFTAWPDFFPDLLQTPERDLSQVAFERGTAYVAAHPKHFAELTARRELMMTCCLDTGVFDSLKAAGFPDAAYDGWRIPACLAWCALAMLVLLHGRALAAAALAEPMPAIALALPATAFVVHSVMEAGNRHMVMNLGAWVTAAMVGLARGARPAADPKAVAR